MCRIVNLDVSFQALGIAELCRAQMTTVLLPIVNPHMLEQNVVLCEGFRADVADEVSRADFFVNQPHVVEVSFSGLERLIALLAVL